MRWLANFLVGSLFSIGLMLAGMTNPQKVLNFLDLSALPTGLWDPSLAFVMAGAVAVGFVGFRLVLARTRPLIAPAFNLPATSPLERRLFVGPAIFGIGWGLVGFCPGPALAALGLGVPSAVLFTAAMLTGMVVARLLAARDSPYSLSAET